MPSNIPTELASLRQWVCFSIEDGQKIPYTPGTDNLAASNRPTDWRSLRQAQADVTSGKREHIGFCFTSSDPFVFIDLDDLSDPGQPEVFERINSYAQRSFSGEGIHLICRGTFKGAGKHPTKPHDAGIFKEGRFCLWTGNVIEGRDKILSVPEPDLQAIHTWLGGGKEIARSELVEYDAQHPDLTIFEMGLDNFQPFDLLSRGDWSNYPSQSEADHAFIAMLCDLSESNEQVRSIFSHSGLWNEKRSEQKRGNIYIDRTISKVRSSQNHDKETHRLLSELRYEVDIPEIELEVAEPIKVPDRGSSMMIDAMPAGLLKEIARYSFSTSYYPLQEASVIASITIMSGICGRGFLTPHNSGLNMWLLMLGGSGCGKDELQSCPKRIFAEIAKSCPNIRRLLGGELVSDPGIETVFNEQLRFISYFKEFGKTFSTMTGARTQDHKKTLMGGLLNSYNLANLAGSLEGRKKAKNEGEQRSIPRPALTIVGDSTPNGLYDWLSTSELESGFLPRFMIFNMAPESWSNVHNEKNGAKPGKRLTDSMTLLVEEMDRFDATENAAPRKIPLSPEADAFLRKYIYQKRIRSGKTSNNGLSEIYNRAGMKVLRLSSLAAVAADFHSPMIELEHVVWATELIDMLDAQLLEKFSSGDVGRGQVKQEAEILKAFTEITKLSKITRKKLGMSPKVAGDDRLCPHGILKSRVVQAPAFAEDRNGAVVAFDKCVDTLVRAGKLVKYPKDNGYAMLGDLLFMP